MLLLIISATYAYFSVTVSGNGSKSMITANTPKKHSLSVSTLYDDIHIHVDNNDMKLANVGSYYGAVNDNRYEKTKEEGTHNIIEVSSKGMENIRYSCSGDIKVTLETKEGSMWSVLEKEDVLLYLKGLGLDETLDLSTLKVNNTKVYQTSFEIDGDSSDYLSAIMELINKESYQNYIANKMLNVKIEAENMVCRENGTYKYLVKLNKNVSDKQNNQETVKQVSIFYDDEGMYQKIQNVYLVDYIDTTKAIKTWELGDTNRGTKSDEVMGWLEKTPDIEDSYDLYIGADGPMRAPQDMGYAFCNFINLKKISGNVLDTSEVTSLFNLFNSDTNLIDISALTNWKVSNVANMINVFSGNSNLSNINALSNWNTKNVTTMQGTFYQNTNLIDLSPISNWDMSSVKTTNSMFAYTGISNIDSLKNWNMSKVANMGKMFAHTSINDLTPIGNWDVSSVDTMEDIFGVTQISDLTPIINWNISNVTNISGMFISTQITDLSPIAQWDVSHVTNMSSIFNDTKIINLSPIQNWDVSHVTNMGNMFAGTLIDDLAPIKDWNISSVTNMQGLFQYSSKLVDISPLKEWNVQNVTNMSNIFANLKIEDFNAIAQWDVSNVNNMNGMFSSTQISDLTPLEDWDVSSVTSMGYMFYNCRNLENIIPIANWNVSKVTNLGDWYYGGIFQGCTNLTKVDLSNWNLPKLDTVFTMFAGDTKLTEIKLPKASYDNLKDLNKYQAMFGGKADGYYVHLRNTFPAVSDNIKVYTESSQVQWVTDRLQEALGENNNSQVIAY